MQFTKSVAHAISLIAAAVLMVVFNLWAGKGNKKWLKEWAMTFSVFGGILVGAFSNALL